MTTFLGIVSVVASVLQIILFFKIWGMTNDVKRLAEKFCPAEKQEQELYSKVKRVSDGKTLIVVKIEDGKYTCMDGRTHKNEGTYTKEDVIPLD